MPKSSNTQLRNLAIKYRGRIIDECCSLEKEIDWFIIEFFTDDPLKGHLLWVSLLDRFHFDGKIAVFEKILQNVAGEKFKKTYGKLFSELRFVKDERNKFAHFVHFIREDGKRTVTLLNFRDEIRLVDYMDENFKMIINRINRCTKEVKKIVKQVHKFLPTQ